MLVNAGIYPAEMAMEDLGITDTDAAQKQIIFEQFLKNEIAILLQTEQAEAQMQQQMAAQQQQMEAQQAQTPTAGLPMLQGQGMNPAQGGLPPAMFMPNATRENQMDVDMQGNPMQGGGMP